jgi:uncharacterized protein (DUF1697 family)
MAKHAAFLRGINLGRHRRVSNTELRSVFEELGFRDVEAFRTSGNVVFEGGRESRAKLTTRIEKGLAKALGYEVSVFPRTASETRAIAEHRPFAPKVVGSSKGKLQVALLLRRPAARARKEVLALATDADRLAFGNRELYWLPSGGTMESTLDLKTIEKLAGPTTRRTKDTLDLLAARFFAD